MYLHELLEGADGHLHRMVGLVPGSCTRGERLKRFGYVKLKARRDGMLCPEGSEIKAHEFHYWNSDCCGQDFTAEKPDGSRCWDCGIMTDDMYAGFPHLFFYTMPKAACGFVKACERYMKIKSDKGCGF